MQTTPGTILRGYTGNDDGPRLVIVGDSDQVDADGVVVLGIRHDAKRGDVLALLDCMRAAVAVERWPLQPFVQEKRSGRPAEIVERKLDALPSASPPLRGAFVSVLDRLPPTDGRRYLVLTEEGALQLLGCRASNCRDGVWRDDENDSGAVVGWMDPAPISAAADQEWPALFARWRSEVHGEELPE